MHGRVQGVLFRRTILWFARTKKLQGFVESKDDGAILVVVQGERKDLDDFLKWLQSQPGFSKVTTMRFSWSEPKHPLGTFRIHRGPSYASDKVKSLANLSRYVLGKYLDHIPRHIAIIPDGNRRWARAHALTVTAGHHRAGSYDHLSSLIREAERLGVGYLSIWAFSTENWSRRETEREAIFGLIMNGLDDFKQSFAEYQIQFRFVGRKDRISQKLLQSLESFEQETKDNDRFTVIFCLDYGGRDELMRAMRALVKSGTSSLTEDDFAKHLDTQGIPDPDLIIRTGGEKRLSGFMPWQSVYTELYFTDAYFPNFDAKGMRKAIEEFSRRQRRFGR